MQHLYRAYDYRGFRDWVGVLHDTSELLRANLVF